MNSFLLYIPHIDKVLPIFFSSLWHSQVRQIEIVTGMAETLVIRDEGDKYVRGFHCQTSVSCSLHPSIHNQQ